MPFTNLSELLTHDHHPSRKNLNKCRIGLELGQRSWQAEINCPQDILDEAGVSQYLHWKGPLDEIRVQAMADLGKVGKVACARGIFANVIYEAGAFGQEIGRDMPDAQLLPWQIVAREIEYTRYGSGNRPVEKTDMFDAHRLSQLDLTHPSLPYTDVQSPAQEQRRAMLSEREQLDKKVKRVNSQISSSFRKFGIDAKYKSHKTWRDFLEKKNLCDHRKTSIARLIDELELHQQARAALTKEMNHESKSQAKNHTPPEPENIVSRHERKPLSADSPLSRMTATQALIRFKGFGLHTARKIDWSCDITAFESSKAFRRFFGFAPCTRNSCTINRSAGVLGGRPQLRKLMIEAAWNWLRYQPDSTLARKYAARLTGTRRGRKIAVCALAGELTEALYKHLIYGKPIAGAVYKF